MTPYGTIVIGTDSVPAVRATARRSWHLQQQQIDPKFGTDEFVGKEVVMEAHKSFVRHDCTVIKRLWRIAAGAPPDGCWRSRYLNRPLEDFPCLCGQVPASAVHLTFECSQRPPGESPAVPHSSAQATYLISAVDLAPARPRVMDQVAVDEAVAKLNHDRTEQNLLVLATDGGAVPEASLYGVASWGIAAYFDGGATISLGGAIAGLDTSAVFAEAWAILHGAHLAARLRAPQVVFVCDSLYVVDALRDLFSQKLLPRVSPALWVRIRELLRPLRWDVSWCPSHGKRPDWAPEAPFQDRAQLWRRLNEVADKEYGRAMAPLLVACRPADQARATAIQWSADALKLRHHMLGLFDEHVKAREENAPADAEA